MKDESPMRSCARATIVLFVSSFILHPSSFAKADGGTVRLREQRVHAKDCVECEQNLEGFVHRIERAVKIEGDLTDEQQARLQEIAHKCPVHKTLTSKIVIAELKDNEAA